MLSWARSRAAERLAVLPCFAEPGCFDIALFCPCLYISCLIAAFLPGVPPMYIPLPLLGTFYLFLCIYALLFTWLSCICCC